MRSKKFILRFEEVGIKDVFLVGGKNASLGEMIQNLGPKGIRIPGGFVVTAEAYRLFLRDTGLEQLIRRTLRRLDTRNLKDLSRRARFIRDSIKKSLFPTDLARAICSAYRNLEGRYGNRVDVAVRSSATAEDSSAAAWAGQLESYLNTTKTNLLENVKKCWASLFTPRAIFYRFEKELHKQKISVAVVVQRMIDSKSSGVAFSVHPVTQDKNQLIIESGFGLGEAIVSGQVTPDSYVVEKKPRQIIDKNIQVQERGIYRSGGGGNEWMNIPKEQGKKQVLSDKEILELSKIILRIENHYDFPCDIEWAKEKGKFYIVQSRPITTLTAANIAAEAAANSIQIIKKVRAMKWEKWLERPFGGFTLSFFADSSKKESFEKIGLKGVGPLPQLFQNGFFYLNKEEMKKIDAQISTYLKHHGMSDITTKLKRFNQDGRKRINKAIKSKKPLEERIAEVFEIFGLPMLLSHTMTGSSKRKCQDMLQKILINS